MFRNTKNVTATCEQDFVHRGIENGLRMDGRDLMEGRSIDIAFSDQDGCCIVIQGNTRVLAQVSCEISAPRPARPAEGAVNINMELSPMASATLLIGRTFDSSVEVSRLLERCIRDSRCIDLESLCIAAGEKVWTIKVDVQALNDDGNLIECASIACMSALAHFKRPHVAVVGTEITVHSLEDHNPVALSLHHMPIIINLAILRNGELVIVDPVEVEERVAQGRVVIAANAHQELCLFHLNGALQLAKPNILKCTKIAINRAQKITQIIRTALDNHSYGKKTNASQGFVSLLQTGTILGAKRPIPFVSIKEVVPVESDEDEIVTVPNKPEPTKKQRKRVAALVNQAEQILKQPSALFQGGSSQWQLSDEDDDSDMEVQVQNGAVGPNKKGKDNRKLNSDEEEEKVVMSSDQVDIKKEQNSGSRKWYSKDNFL